MLIFKRVREPDQGVERGFEVSGKAGRNTGLIYVNDMHPGVVHACHHLAWKGVMPRGKQMTSTLTLSLSAIPHRQSVVCERLRASPSTLTNGMVGSSLIALRQPTLILPKCLPVSAPITPHSHSSRHNLPSDAHASARALSHRRAVQLTMPRCSHARCDAIGQAAHNPTRVQCEPA